MKFNNTFTNNNSLFLRYALLQDSNSNISINGNSNSSDVNSNGNSNINGNGSNGNSLSSIKAEYKTFFKEIDQILKKVSNYFDGNNQGNNQDDHQNDDENEGKDQDSEKNKGQDKDHTNENGDQENEDSANTSINVKKQNVNTADTVNVTGIVNATKTTNTIDIDELLRNVNEIIGIDEFTGIDKTSQLVDNTTDHSVQDSVSDDGINTSVNTSSYTDNHTLYTPVNPITNINTNINMNAYSNQNDTCHYQTQNGTTDENDIEESMLSFVDRLKPQTSKITIVEKNHIKTEIELTNNELLILKLAVLHNNNTVNLMNRTEDIKNLMNKGLLHISENGCSLVVDKIVEVIIKTNTHKGNMVVVDYDDSEENSEENQDSQGNSQGNQVNQANGEKDSVDDTNEIIEKELSSDDYHSNVQSFEWEIDCCMDKEIGANS